MREMCEDVYNMILQVRRRKYSSLGQICKNSDLNFFPTRPKGDVWQIKTPKAFVDNQYPFDKFL